jgi:lysyl-tRNA synthetase, class II
VSAPPSGGGHGAGSPPTGEAAEPHGGEAEILAARRRKLEELRAAGVDPFPHEFPGVIPIAQAREGHDDLKPGGETDTRVRVAGRVAARRGQGKAAFLDLVDRSGRIQLLGRVNVLGDEQFGLLTSLDLGDMIGADGTIIRSRAGELTVALDGVTLLAKSLRPPPEKHHGLTDVETRFRHRELDLMANEETRETFIARAKVITETRRFLDDAGFIEVETPILQPIYGGAAARPFVTRHNALDRDLYLRIATELYLKRLIVGGLERVYEIGKNFRNEGLSPKHNPEFTVIEWYEAYADYQDVANRLERLVAHVAGTLGVSGFEPPWHRETLGGAIEQRTGVDIYAHRELDALRAAMRERGLDPAEHEHTWARMVDHLLSRYVEPTLTEPTLLFDYPVELSPLAKKHRTQDGLVERFEAFAGGMEFANAFTELNDPDDQRARFEAQRAAAAAGDEEAQPFDADYVAALEHGMPPAGGIGIGIDRLVMLLTGRTTIREVVLFPAMRAQ